MTRDDYLDDPRAPQDPEAAALERALAPLRFAGAVPAERVLAVELEQPPRYWLWLAGPLAAAAAVWLWFALTDDALRSDALRPDAEQRTFVAKKRAVVIQLGALAEITLHPGSELEFAHWRADELRFRLRHGRLTARVQPPPVVEAGFFVIETARSELVDSGCHYDLSAKPDGSARVRVTAGAVTFAGVQKGAGRKGVARKGQARVVFVPAGASVAMSAAGAVSTPMFLDGSPTLRDLVRLYDESLDLFDDQRRVDIVSKLLASCSRARDTLPLWHLLSDPDPMIPKMATERLFDLVDGPDGSSRTRMFPAEKWLDFLRVAVWQ